jgi:NADH-ubiquinone oxidoreductase chain 5
MLTAFYSFRLISMTFFTIPNAPKADYEHTHEQPTLVVVPYVILSLLAILFGYFAKDLFVGMGSDFLSSALFIHPNHITLVDAEFALTPFYKLLPGVGSVLSAGAAFYLYNYKPDFLINLTQTKLGYTVYTLLNGKYHFDVLYNRYLINGALSLGLVTSKVLDKGIIELIGPFGLTESLYNSSRKIAS